MKSDETHARHMNWQPTAGSGYTRTVSSDDLPGGCFLSSYKYGPWQFTIDGIVSVECFDIDDLKKITQKLEQLNDRDTQNGRDTHSERSEGQIPDF